LLFYAVSRTCRSKRQLVEIAAALCTICAVMAALAIFERAKGWLLFVDIPPRWGAISNANYYLMRGGSVRAQVSAGHSIALGFAFAIGFGFWLYLKSHVESHRQRIGITLLLGLGLIATFSRDAWLGGAVIYFAFIVFGPRAVSRLVKGAALASALGGVLLASPIGSQILDMLPQPGQPADLYRHRLAERGWDLVLAHPYFGDRLPWPDMEDLRQGEGIIDLVNTYLGVALDYGFVGLSIFVGFILLGVLKVYARIKEMAGVDEDLSLLGATLNACIVGTLVMIDSTGFNLAPEKLFLLLAGLAAAFSQLERPPKSQAAPQPAAMMPGERL
jgi:O-antigen ligase